MGTSIDKNVKTLGGLAVCNLFVEIPPSPVIVANDRRAVRTGPGVKRALHHPPPGIANIRDFLDSTVEGSERFQ
jgi:hypothetical protein